jgi:hypothetical protein
MNVAIQHLLVLLLVLICAGVVGVQAFSSLRGKRSKLGSCCAKGCGESTQTKGERIVFLPVEMVGRKRP